MRLAPTLIAFAAALAPCLPAAFAAGVDDQLVRVATDDIGKDPALKKAAITLGRDVYIAHCAACHGADLKGMAGKHAPDLSDKATLYGSDNLDAEPEQIPPSDIETIVKYGIRADYPKTRKLFFMPSFAGLDPRQEGGYPTLGGQGLGDLVEYLIVLQGQASDAADAVRDKALYASNFSDCHSRDAKGNPGIGATNLTSKKYL